MNEMVIIIRPSFKKICGPDACRAAVYNHILYRLARKAKDEPEEKVKKGEVFWFASAEDICKDMDNAWCVNKIRKEVKVLFESGILGQRHNPLKKWDRKFQYFVSEEQGVKLLEKCKETGVCLMHLGLNAEVLHLLFMVNAFDKYGGCKCQKEEMDTPNMVDAITKYGRAIPKGSTKGSSEEPNQEESTDASALASAAHTPFQQEQAEQIRIATSAQEEQEKAGQNEHTVSRHYHSERHPRVVNSFDGDKAVNVDMATHSPQEVTSEDNSHSEVTQANQVAAVPSGRAKEVPPDEQKTPPRPRRTPPVHKENLPSPEQIESVFACLEQSICRLTEQTDFTYSRTKAAKAAVKDWLTGRPEASQKKLSWHVTTLYHKPKDEKTGFYWREHLSVAAILNNYDREIVNYKPDAPGGTPGKPRATALVSEEQAKKNMDKMRANVAAKQAAMAASGK